MKRVIATDIEFKEVYLSGRGGKRELMSMSLGLLINDPMMSFAQGLTGRPNRPTYGIQFMGLGIGPGSNGTYMTMAMPEPYDPTQMWRVFEILKKTATLNVDMLPYLFQATSFNAKAIPPIGVDAHTFFTVMKAQVPDFVIEHLVELHAEGYALDLEALQVEIDLGRLQWNSQLSAVGLLHPDQSRQRAQCSEEIIARYKADIFAFARVYSLFNMNAMIRAMERAVVDAVSKGIEDEEGMDGVMAWAFFEGMKADMMSIGDSLGFPGMTVVYEKSFEYGYMSSAAFWCDSQVRLKMKSGAFRNPNRKKAEQFLELLERLDSTMASHAIVHPLFDEVKKN